MGGQRVSQLPARRLAGAPRRPGGAFLLSLHDRPFALGFAMGDLGHRVSGEPGGAAEGTGEPRPLQCSDTPSARFLRPEHYLQSRARLSVQDPMDVEKASPREPELGRRQ